MSGATLRRLATRLSCFAFLVFGLLSPPPASAQEVKIGILFGVTGEFSSFVPSLLDSVKLAVDEINAGGGILEGQKLQTVLADTKGTGQGAIDAATTLVKTDDVAAIVGANTGTTTIAAAHAVTVPNGVLLISPSATATVMTTMEDKDFVFRLAPSDAYQGWALAKFAHDQGFERVAMTFVGNEYGAGMQITFRDNFENYGGTITVAQVHESNKASYLPELEELNQFQPQALVVIDYAAAGGITMIKEALAKGIFKYFIGPHSMMDPLLLREVGADKLKGSIFTVPTIDYSTSAAEKFQKLYGAAFKTTENKLYIGRTYDAVMLTALAIQKAGSTDRTKIRSALREICCGPGEVIEPGEWAKAKAAIAAGKKINYEGASGNCDFDENGDIIGAYGLYMVENGAFKQVGLFKR